MATATKTPSTSKAPPRLSDEQIVELLQLTKKSDSVELKLTVPESDQRSAVGALGMDPLNAQIRLVSFFDTPELVLNQNGVVVRARRVQRKGDDSIIKLRPVVPDELPKELRSSPNFGVEVDAMPGGFVCSGTLKEALGTSSVKKVNRGKRPPSSIFSKEQQNFYAQHAPEGIGLDDLSLLGPIFVLKLKFSPGELDRKLVAELWLFPDNSRVLELSTKCAPSEAFQVAAELRAFLSERGINLEGEQQAKTSKALRFFSKQLAQSA
jgi:hypothetical protein